MPRDTDYEIAERNRIVNLWQIKQAALKHEQSQALSEAQEAVLAFLQESHFDRIIRQILREKRHPFLATKLIKDEIPLDGQPKTKYPPAFVFGHTGQRLVSPGMRYSFRIGLDETVISVTICKSERGNIFPYFFVTHEDGRYHQVDWQVAFRNPSDNQLTAWLQKELSDSNSPL